MVERGEAKDKLNRDEWLGERREEEEGDRVGIDMRGRMVMRRGKGGKGNRIEAWYA